MIFAGEFQRGETITLRIGVDAGDIGAVTGLPTATLKPARPGTAAPPREAVPALFALSVDPAPEDEGGPAGWNVTVTAAQTAGLALGSYATDFRCVLGAGIYKAEAVRFRLIEAVTS